MFLLVISNPKKKSHSSKDNTYQPEKEIKEYNMKNIFFTFI